MHNITNAVLASCRVNLTANRVDEYYSGPDININYTEGMQYDTLCDRIFMNIENREEYENATNTLRRTVLLQNFKDNISWSKVIYRRRSVSGSFIWIETTMNLMKEPETGDIIGFAYARDCSCPSEAATRSERMLMQFKRAADKTYYFVMSLDYSDYTYDFIQLNEKSKARERPLSGSIDVYIKFAAGVFGDGFNEMSRVIGNYDALVKAMGSEKELVYEIYSDSGCGMHWFEHRIIRSSDRPDDKMFLCLTSIIDKRKHKEEILRRALEKADAGRKAKRDFITHMSRELRTPLNGITGMLELLKQRPELENDKCLQNAVMSSNHLNCLMCDILDMTALENGSLKLQMGVLSRDEFDGFIRSIIQPLADRKQIIYTVSFSSDYCPDLICDISRLMQIMINLLSNAVKFTPVGGSVMLDTHLHSREDGFISVDFTVSDTGIGMSEEFLSHAFEPFDRGTAAENTEGTGLGLAIVKKLVDLMGGNLRITSIPDSGTIAVVTLRLRIADENDIRRHKHSHAVNYDELPDLNGKHALVVEDNRLNMEVAEYQLRSLHLIVDKAANGLEAIQAFENSYDGYYDIIFMDVVMPKCDGISATRTIRHMDRPDAKTIPIVAMTANAFPDDAQKCFESGMNYHLAKPFQSKDIQKILIHEFAK